MKARIIAATSLAVCALAGSLLLPHPLHGAPQDAAHAPAPTPGARNNARAYAAGENTEHLLFPGLDSNAVTAVSVSSPDSSFEFLCKNASDVSVNGHEADREVFHTLISQIAEITVSPADSIPAGSRSLLQLSVTAGGTRYEAAFYAGGADDAHAFILSGDSAPVYHRTAGWRVGTLMMTCEGTRIQDERGNESPAD